MERAPNTHTNVERIFIMNGTVDESSDTPIENVMPNCEALYNYSFFVAAVVVRTPYVYTLNVDRGNVSIVCV